MRKIENLGKRLELNQELINEVILDLGKNNVERARVLSVRETTIRRYLGEEKTNRISKNIWNLALLIFCFKQQGIELSLGNVVSLEPKLVTSLHLNNLQFINMNFFKDDVVRINFDQKISHVKVFNSREFGPLPLSLNDEILNDLNESGIDYIIFYNSKLPKVPRIFKTHLDKNISRVKSPIKILETISTENLISEIERRGWSVEILKKVN